MEECLRFIARLLDGESMSEVPAVPFRFTFDLVAGAVGEGARIWASVTAIATSQFARQNRARLARHGNRIPAVEQPLHKQW